ncbi:MAG: protein kinase [Deltaproteobacteria bacterium]|nr:protein kinase [Deltaproteobacteria bacterium]
MPKLIGHFDVLSELGRGGMGIVYKVKDQKSGAFVALKMIPPEALSRPDSALRFKREFRAMQRVEHPNVIRVYEAGTHEGCPFFTMELVDGKEIRRYVDGEEAIVPNGKDGPPNNVLSVEQRTKLNEPQRVKKVADMIIQVAFALAEIHSHRIVHRDLKPDNILVSKQGVAKLMDFGIAKQLSANSEHSSGGMVVGTFKYLSPEQALGGEIDGRADLYCLGIIFYELLTGRHPFYSENSVGYAYHHARKPPPEMEKFNPEVNPKLKAVCEKLIKKDQRERFPTAEDVIAAVREAMDDPADLPSGPQETSTRMRTAGPAPVKNLPFELAKDQLFQPAHVGRAAESRMVTAVVERLAAGKGAIVVVNGPQGIGKSRLLREVAVPFKQKNIDFVWGRCLEQGAPYQPFVEILDTLVAEVEGRPADEIRRLLGDEARVLARYVPALERLDPAVRPRPSAALEPQGERLRFLSAVTAFIGRLNALVPRVLVIDNLHLADELSLSLTRHLIETLARADSDSSMQRGAPIGLALTLDPAHKNAADLAPLLARVAAAPAGETVSLTLSALAPVDVRELLASMMGGGEVAQALADYLHTETGGAPGAVEDRVRAWAESGELRRKGRQWVFVRKALKPGESSKGQPQVIEVRAATRWDIPIPDFEENTNQKRVARLSTVAKDVGERLAILGDRFGGQLGERVALRPEDEFLDALDELIKRAILAEDKEDGAYRFTDPDDRRALMAGLKVERRQQLHLLCARALEEDARRRRRPGNPEELAHHYFEAKEPVMAIEQMMSAARIALSASATQTAAQRVREAQELLASEQADEAKNADKRVALDPRLTRADVELVLLRLDVLAAVNEHKECVTLARRRLPRMQGAVDGKLVAEVLLRLAASERVLGDLDAALEHTGQVLSRTERGGSHGLRCRAKSLCGQIYEQRGQFELAERYFHDALELARTIGDELEEERARWAIAARHLTAGNLDEAARDFEQLLTQANTRGEKLRVTQYVNALGIVAHEQARYDDAEAAYRRMIELAKPAGDRRSLANALNNIAVVRRDQGRYDDALALTSKAARILADLDQVENLAYVRIVEAQILLDRAASTPAGEPGQKTDNQDALKKADEALDLGLKANAALKVAEAALCRGLALCRKGDVAGGEDIARGMQAGRTLNANRIALFGLLCDVEAAMLVKDRARAQHSLDEGLARARRTNFVRFEKKLRSAAARLGLT